MKLGMENVLKGKVVEIKKGMMMTEVKVDVGGSDIITVIVTDAALKELGASSGGGIGGYYHHPHHGCQRIALMFSNSLRREEKMRTRNLLSLLSIIALLMLGTSSYAGEQPAAVYGDGANQFSLATGSPGELGLSRSWPRPSGSRITPKWPGLKLARVSPCNS